jgi:hypothetical protein
MASTSLSLTPVDSAPERRLLRHVNTGRFLSQDGGWTNEEEQAASFPNFLALVQFCLQNNVADVEIIVREEPNSKPTVARLRELLKNATTS